MTQQFADFMKSITSGEFCKDMSKMDFSSITDATKKTVENIFSANKIATENFQSIATKAEKTAEMLKNNGANALQSLQESIKSGDMKEFVACQQKCLKTAFDTYTDNLQSLFQMSMDSSKKIFSLMDSNVSEHLKGKNDKK